MSATAHILIARQRLLLRGALATPLRQIAQRCAAVWPLRAALEYQLGECLAELPGCVALYALDLSGRQFTATLTRAGLVLSHCGRSRCDRRELASSVRSATLTLSTAYRDPDTHQPLLTAICAVIDATGTRLGLLGADFELRALPLTRALFSPDDALTMPSVAPRVSSALDEQREALTALLVELIGTRGVFQCEVHFASAHILLWLLDDPYRFRLLTYADLTQPHAGLVYPRRPYPATAEVPREHLAAIVARWWALRCAEGTLYLRRASLNVFNGLIGLSFSLDGSQYLSWRELLDQPLDCWLGTGDADLLREISADPQR